MSVTIQTVPIRTRCVGCVFYEWSKPDYWLTGKCTNKLSAVRNKDKRYGMDKRCVKWQPAPEKGGEG